MAVMLVCSLRTVLSDERDAAVRGGMADDEIRRRLLVAGRNQAKKGVRAARKGKKKRRKKELSWRTRTTCSTCTSSAARVFLLQVQTIAKMGRHKSPTKVRVIKVRQYCT
jgi:hypothetical protein